LKVEFIEGGVLDGEGTVGEDGLHPGQARTVDGVIINVGICDADAGTLYCVLKDDVFDMTVNNV